MSNFESYILKSCREIDKHSQQTVGKEPMSSKKKIDSFFWKNFNFQIQN